MSGFVHIKPVATNRVLPPETLEVKLTEVESQVCTLLDECTRQMKDEKGLSTSCRVAGGWVRDKLLGSQNNDIDIAVENMMGVTFAEHFVSFVSLQKDLPVKAVTKIERNPDQSKHLETGRTTVLDIEMDFVNLRSEEYAGDSRIPTEIAFGTPLQDALRRDLTINTLFYNVHSRSVEDFTGKGLDDLKNGIIRTPLPPKETFNDDPLRIIRCIRFASRFGFDVVPELKEAALDPTIQEALSLKISRERIGEELDKMMKGRDPLRSIQLIQELSLYPHIFSIPEAITSTFSSTPGQPITSVSAATLLRALIEPQTASISSSIALPSVHKTLLSSTLSPGTKSRLFLAAALTPYRGILYTDSKKKSHFAVEAAIREGTRLGTQNHYLDGIPALFVAADRLKDPRLNNDKFQSPCERVAIGLLLRDKCVHNPNTGSHWATSVLFSLLQELVPTYDAVEDQLDINRASALIHTYNVFVSRIEELGLHTSVEAKPILDGRQVIEAMGASRPGAWTGQILARVIEWQLEHPDGTMVECEAWLRAEREAGRIRVENCAPDSASKRTKVTGSGPATKNAKR
ncbi:hypothetical protein PILCRDRAFT_818258 [Piloderma croceum F 1598]|uniref:Poly A polymerase head domain-containing protein n=1 Tax=Piloderma croceum (strain F 1598) TaxID=765440 RepID=A0A0C3FKU0_PILCF|nr:hypothetical protein PILCRDRAFT_818258 [Piloderma croceum F 1598]